MPISKIYKDLFISTFMVRKEAFTKKVLERIKIINEAYENEGDMTVRRCFYILVGKNKISNSKVSYKLLSKVLTKARELGYVGWDVISDRHRTILKRSTYTSFDEIFDIACQSFRKNSMELQDNYVEVWIEKDAVSSIIYNYTYDLDIPLFVGKGFPSTTYIKKASDRIKEINKPCVILYISDFDPEGEYFPKKVQQKLEQYGCSDFRIEKVALTKEQREKYNLPSNKDFTINKHHKDKIYVQDFIDKHGIVQIELDALENSVLVDLLRKSIEKLIDVDLHIKSDEESLEEVERWGKDNLQ